MRKTRAIPASLQGFFAGGERQRSRHDERVPLDLNDRERKLILHHTFADDLLPRRLRIVPRAGESAACRFTWTSWRSWRVYLAAEANHARDKQLKKQLSRLFDRMWAVLESYTDEEG